MTTVGVVTSSRADLNFTLPLMRALERHPAFTLKVVATGMHLAQEFGMTVQAIETAGFPVHARVESLVGTGEPEAVATSIGTGVTGFAKLFATWRPELLVVFGDRFEMFPAAVAALPFRIPVVHLAGGEITEGAIDDALRHSLTKLSHLHFVAMDAYRRRIIQMGEEPWRVMVSGALALDAIRDTTLWTPEETATQFGFNPNAPVALVTFHPVTLEVEQTGEQIHALLSALDRSGIQCLFSYPNADTAYREVVEAIQQFCDGRVDRWLLKNAGQVGYYSLLNTVSVMVGNSSSGLVEAPSFTLPVVNVGTRQDGRLAPDNVIPCGNDTEGIAAALTRALDPGFRAGLQGLRNPYGEGHAADRIVEHLATLCHRSDLLRKKFIEELSVAPEAVVG